MGLCCFVLTMERQFKEKLKSIKTFEACLYTAVFKYQNLHVVLSLLVLLTQVRPQWCCMREGPHSRSWTAALTARLPWKQEWPKVLRWHKTVTQSYSLKWFSLKSMTINAFWVEHCFGKWSPNTCSLAFWERMSEVGCVGWTELEWQRQQFLKMLSFTVNVYLLNKYFRDLRYHKIIQKFFTSIYIRYQNKL